MRSPLIALIAAGACAASLTAPIASADLPPYSINVILSLTGQGAFVGKAQHDTLVALENVENRRGGIAGRPIRFEFKDDQTNPQVAVQAVNAVIAEHPAILVGPSIAVTCRAAAPLVGNGPVTYCLSPSANPAKGSYLFSAIVATREQVQGLFRYARERGWTRVAVLNPTDATGQDADEAITAATARPENHDISVVANEHFTITDLSVTAQLSRIKAANPRVLVSWTTGTPFATVLRGISDVGLDTPLVASPGNMTYAQMHEYAKIMPKELYFPTEPYVLPVPQRELVVPQQEFVATFKALGVRPDLQTGIAWDAAKLMIGALRKLGPTASAQQVRDYLFTVHDFPGICGVYDFRDGSNRGLSAKDALLARWDPAQDTWIAVSRLGFGPLR